MAYFLPSYFQKRLLRYALSRIDFIDNDALNLEDLDLNIGQRSVIELKNVGIRVSKLVEKIDLPATIQPRHALIRLLRITVPANLHSSGIEIEVDGVDIEVAVDTGNDDKRKAQRRGAGNVPSHRDVANRPRIASNETHDPGGRNLSSRGYNPVTSTILPAPEDLAASFLQTEPEQEKRELQAEIASRSVLVQQSSSGLDGSASEDGIGMPEGFSLPGFVSNYLAGIADRLFVSIRRIAIKVSLPLENDRAAPDSVDLLLKVEEVDVQPISQPIAVDGLSDMRRAFRISGVELLVVSDADVFTQKSTVSSPRLSKSRSTASTISRRGADHSYRPYDSSSSSSFASSNQDLLSQSVHESMMEASQLFEPSLVESRYASSTASPELHRLSPVTSREDGAETPLGMSNMGNEQSRRTSYPSRAKSPSHEDDESMYLSFVSARSSSERMPGGFESGSPGNLAEPRVRTISSDTLRPISKNEPSSLADQTTRPIPTASVSDEMPPVSNLPFTRPPAGRQQCAKRFFRINDISLKLPLNSSRSERTYETAPPIYAGTNSAVGGSDMSKTQYFASASHIRSTSEQSTYGIPKDLAVRIDGNNSYGIDIGDVELIADVPLCHLLLKIATQLTSISPSPPSKQPTAASASTSAMTTPDLHLNASFHSLVINVMETVPEVEATTTQYLPTESTFSIRGEQSPLLQLQMLSARLQMARVNQKIDSRFSLHRLGLYRESEKIISFYDPSTVQGSFVASSVMIDPDDVVVRQLNNRFDIAVKPMQVRLDLLLLDDVLSRSGGLSSLLDLGSSVASASTTRDTTPRVVQTRQRRRSVHFDDSVQAKRPRSDSDTVLKLNMRIAAVVLDLVGSQSSLQIRTSSVKTVYRSSGLRTNISSITVKGPVAREGVSTDILALWLGDLELAYADNPSEDDLDRLLNLLAPSSDQHDEQDDDIMVDTLLRQRRKGGVLRLSLKEVQLTVNGVTWVQRLSKLGEEISKLSTVTKYLPEDDRPGVLTFAVVNKLTTKLELDQQFGPLTLKSHLFEGAHISVPSLMAMRISSVRLTRGLDQPLIRELIPNIQENTIMGPGMVMCRFIPDEMEPTVKLKLSDLALEYSVPLLLAITHLGETLQSSLSKDKEISSPRISEASSMTSENSDLSRKIKFSITLRNTAVSLKPLGSPACGLFVFTDTMITYEAKRQTKLIKVDMRKASLMIIDDVARSGSDSSGADVKFYFDQTDQIQELIKNGFVPVGSISAAEIEVKIIDEKANEQSFVEVELRNNLLVLETCADSTQTLTQILGGLSPPSAPSKIEKFRTQVVPIEDMLASWTGNAFVAENGPEMGMQVVEEEESTPTPSTLLEAGAQNELSQILGEDDDEVVHNLQDEDLEDFVQDSEEENFDMTQSVNASIGGRSLHIAPVNITADEKPATSDSVMMHSLIDFRDDHFMQTSTIGGTAHRWDSTQNTYAMGKERDMQRSPLKVKVRDVHIIWNLFDGYDWQYTRDTISHAVQEVESKALAKQRRRDSQRGAAPDADDESVVGDVLFNSIYINIPANRDPRELANAINFDLGDVASETGSYATSTTVTATTSKRHSGSGSRSKRLRLKRSKSHKITFELEGLAADFLTFPPGSGEIESSVDVRVRNVEVFDHLPTSRWRKFASYMYEAGDREVGTDMVHIELLNVKPVAELAASEIVLKLTVLPLRLHVDQDALDFITRFFEFKDDRVVPSGMPSSPPFIQRAEVNPIRIRLDFKPKRVDYAGLKSGKLTEFMNFIILEGSDLVLRRTILYGVSGFDRLGIMLNNIWTPDVRNNQLPGVLAGLAPIRPLVDVGSGIRDLIAVPIREYRKDGRVVRSIQKGAFAFAKTTTTELVNLGAKLAIGTQTVLQNAEDLLAPQNKSSSGFNSDSDDEDYQKEISNYADQPLGIVQGLRGAYASLERDLLLAKDAIVAVPGEIIADGSATGAAKVILKQSPTIILRPAIGITKAVGQAFLGAGNTLDRGNRRRIEDKYKRHH